jgi:hypothetical protein
MNMVKKIAYATTLYREVGPITEIVRDRMRDKHEELARTVGLSSYLIISLLIRGIHF